MEVAGLRGGVVEREARDGGMLPTLAVGWRASAVRVKKQGASAK